VTSERDDFDVFLDTWEPGPILNYATLPPNLNDPMVRLRLLDDSTGVADLTRTANASGMKVIGDEEGVLRGYEFFKTHQPKWSAHFRDQVESAGVDADKLDSFIRSFSTHWLDGRRRRQDSPLMMGIKAAIRDHDRVYHAQNAGRFVLSPVNDAKAKAAGVYKGRKPSVDVLQVRALKQEGIGPSAIAKTLGIGRASVYRALGEHTS
jgi:hypothetical protein